MGEKLLFTMRGEALLQEFILLYVYKSIGARTGVSFSIPRKENIFSEAAARNQPFIEFTHDTNTNLLWDKVAVKTFLMLLILINGNRIVRSS